MSDESLMTPLELVNKMIGTKTMFRRRKAGVEVGFIKGKVSRKGLKIIYSICGIVDLNKRFHGSQVFSAVRVNRFKLYMMQCRCLTMHI